MSNQRLFVSPSGFGVETCEVNEGRIICLARVGTEPTLVIADRGIGSTLRRSDGSQVRQSQEKIKRR